MEQKQCSRCKEWKNIDEFYKDKSYKSGYRSICKKCVVKKQRQYDNANRDKRREKGRRWYENNKEYASEKSRMYRENNKEILSKKFQEYYNTTYKQMRKDKFEMLRLKNTNEIVDLLKSTNPNSIKINLPVFGCIYRIYNTKTKRSYIGQTINPLRTRYHGDVIKTWIKERKDKTNQKFKEELIEEDFEVTEVLDVGCCKYHLDKLEVYYINYYNSYKEGYNNQPGNYKSDDGLEEFEQILKEHGVEFSNLLIKE